MAGVRTGRLALKEHRYHVGEGRRALATVAFVLAATALLQFLLLVSQVDRFRQVARPPVGERIGEDPEVIQFRAHVMRQSAGVGLRLLLGAAFLLLRLWADDEPGRACRLALSLYLPVGIGLIVLTGSLSWAGILMDVVVVLSLSRGARSARALLDAPSPAGTGAGVRASSTDA